MRNLLAIRSRFMCGGLRIGIAVLVVGIAPAAQAQIEQAPGQPQADTFRSSVTLIRTDAIVRDANGAFVDDLTPADFRIEEDGVPQEVASLILVLGGRVFNQLVPPPPPAQEGIILPQRRARSQTPGRIIVFFVDAMHLEASTTPRVRHFVKEVADTLVHDGDLVGLVSNGAAGTTVALTYDLEHVKSAVDGIVGSGLTPRDLIESMQEGPDGPGELRWRAHRAFMTVNDVLEGLTEIQDRRKVIIYISTGYDLNPFALQRLARAPLRDELLRDRPIDLAGGGAGGADARALRSPFNRIERQGVVFADGELITELVELSDTATRANATLYTMDPRGLISSPDLDYDVPIDAWREYMMAARSSLRTLAELTGGMSIVNTNNFAEMLRQIDAETSDYYIVGYYTSNPDPTHRRRSLRVTVARDGLEVQARDSYTLARTGAPTGVVGP